MKKRTKNKATLSGITMGLCACCLCHAYEPSIGFTDIPGFGATGNLKGEVGNVVFSDYSVAVYIYVSGWWTKPTFAAPLTGIEDDGSWECNVTTGGNDLIATRFAAFLVPSSYFPPQASGATELPAELYSNAVARVVASRPAGREFDFSGYRWWAKETFGGYAGPGPNHFSGSTNNVWVDAMGRLHLRIMEVDEKWQCAEVVSMRSFGYGTYRVFVDTPPESIDLNTVLGLFTWSDVSAYAHREIDVEVSTWGNAAETNNAQFVVQPWSQPGHLTRFRVPPGQSNATHCFQWSSNSVEFASYSGHYEIPPALNATNTTWVFSSVDVPPEGDENFRMNLWLYNGSPPSSGEAIEIIISRFVFVPQEIAPPVFTGIKTLSSGAIEFIAETEPQLEHRVMASTNMQDWILLETVTAPSNLLTFIDAGATTNPCGFYHLVLPPQ